MHLKRRLRCIVFLHATGQSQSMPARTYCRKISHPEMHLKPRLQYIYCFLYSTQPKPVSASAHIQKWPWNDVFYVLCFILNEGKANERQRALTVKKTSRNAFASTSPMYCVFIFRRDQSQWTSARTFFRNITSPNALETTSSMVRVLIFNSGKASELQRALIVKWYNIQKCTWKRRLRCVAAFLYSIRPKPVNASAHLF